MTLLGRATGTRLDYRGNGARPPQNKCLSYEVAAIVTPRQLGRKQASWLWGLSHASVLKSAEAEGD